MKTIGFEKESLDSCAMIIGMDEDRKSLGGDTAFWKLIEERRSQNVVSREELESILHAD